MDFGRGNNNYAELFTLKLLLYFAIENECTQLEIFGDSMIVINWINKVQSWHNVFLNIVLMGTQRCLEEFDSFSFQHVYRERNTIADQLSKLGLILPLDQ